MNKESNKMLDNFSLLKYLFIINERAGSGKSKKSIPFLLELIKSKNLNYSYYLTDSLNSANDVIRKSNDYDIIVSVGGDGTLNGVINSVIELNKIIGIIPLGSGNDFPVMLNISNNICIALDTLINGRVTDVDVGYLKTEKFSKYFINAVGIGFDAKVGYTKNQITYIDGGLSKYIIALFSSLISYKSPAIEIIVSETEIHHSNFFLITVGNGKRTGGGFLLTPDAKIDDALFDICLVDKISKIKVIKEFPKVLKGLHKNIKEVKFCQSSSVSIKSDSNLYIHYDGETPDLVKNIQVNILPKRMRMISNQRFPPEKRMG